MTLFVAIERETGKPPIVVDSDVLSRDPQQTLQELCARLEIPFYTEQLNWPAGPKVRRGGKEEREREGEMGRLVEPRTQDGGLIVHNPRQACDGVWAGYWYKKVHQSCGFEDKGASSSYRRFPPALIGLLRQSLPFYEAISAHAIRPSTGRHVFCFFLLTL